MTPVKKHFPTLPKHFNHRNVFHALDFSKYEADTTKLATREDIEKPKRMTTPTTWLKLDPGEYVVRLLPSAAEVEPFSGMPYLRLWQHWGVGPNEERVLCPEKMAEERGDRESCFVCEQVSALYATGAKPDEKLANKLRAKQSFVYQVIDRDDPVWTEADEGVDERPEVIGTPKIKKMRLPWTGHSQVLDYYTDAEYGDLSHPISGLDVIVKRTGTGIDTSYGIKTKRKNSPLFQDSAGDPDETLITQALEGMDVLHDHPFFQPSTYDETLAIWSGIDDKKDAPAAGSVASGAAPVAGALPAHTPGTMSALAKWVKAANTPEEAMAPPRAMTRNELAAWGGWSETDLASCYAEDPDHQSAYCLECPLAKPCASSYFKQFGKYSVSAPDPAPVSAPTGKPSAPTEKAAAPPSGKPAPVAAPTPDPAPVATAATPEVAPVPSGEESSVQQLSSFLKGSGAEDPTE